MIETLADRIWGRSEFQAEYRALLRASLRRSLRIGAHTPPAVPPADGGAAYEPAPGEAGLRLFEQIDERVVRRLLQSATHFSATGRPAYREAAYRIASATWTLLNDHRAEYDNLRAVVQVVLGRLGNFPAVQFLFTGVPEEPGAALPLAVWLELTAHQDSNSVQVAPEMRLTLTDFQRSLWERLESRRSAAVTAPTSAGKSYALGHYLARALGESMGRWGVYLVPTRALINQVSTDLLDRAAQVPQGALTVSTIPVPPADLGMTGGIYVVTQERLQVLLNADPELVFDLAVVDEAQMLADPSRGIILQTVVEELLRRSPGTQLLFGSPQTRNPEVYGRLFGVEVDAIPQPERPVAQNLVLLDTDMLRRDRVEVSALVEGVRERLGTVVLDGQLFGDDQSLAFLSFAFGAGDKNLVYAGGKAKCEDIADRIRQLVDERAALPPEEIRPELAEFAAFIRTHVHSQYALATTVTRGVAFHYGNMPALIRKTLEEYFSEGKLSFLVCTSTLLHGVNLPAKNLFLLNPTKGREWGTREDIPITPLEFWNLAGRAGRLGKEFEGNVFLVDYARWQVQPLDTDRDQSVTPSLEQTVVDRRAEFLTFVRDRDHASGSNEAAENTFVKLVNEARAGRLERTLQRMFPDTGGPDIAAARVEVGAAVAEAVDEITVSEEVTRKNITVSVFRQQEMFDYLRRRIGEDGPRPFIPVHPARPWPEAHRAMLRLFKRIHTHFERLPAGDGSHKFFAPLALRWMRGDPLPVLIDAAIVYERRRHPGASTARVIRDTLENIENELRFRYVKYTSCYLDLLAEALRAGGHEDYLVSVPPIALYLELGVSSKTMISLIGLGLSRTTAGLVASRAANMAMERPDTRRWLAAQRWEESGLSPICVREIRRVLGAPG